MRASGLRKPRIRVAVASGSGSKMIPHREIAASNVPSGKSSAAASFSMNRTFSSRPGCTLATEREHLRRMSVATTSPSAPDPPCGGQGRLAVPAGHVEHANPGRCARARRGARLRAPRPCRSASTTSSSPSQRCSIGALNRPELAGVGRRHLDLPGAMIGAHHRVRRDRVFAARATHPGEGDGADMTCCPFDKRTTRSSRRARAPAMLRVGWSWALA